MTTDPGRPAGDDDIFVGGIDVEGGVLAGPDAVIPTVILHVTGFAGMEERRPVQLRLHLQAEDLAGLARAIETTAAQSVDSAERVRRGEPQI